MFLPKDINFASMIFALKMKIQLFLKKKKKAVVLCNELE